MSRPNTPTYKKLNWPSYNEALKRRGSLTVWFDPDMAWAAKPTGKRGRQPAYSDAAVQTCLTMKVLFGCWQTNANLSPFAQTRRASGRAEAAPLSECGGAGLLEEGPGGEGAFLVEVVEDRGVDGSELLQCSHAPEAEHRPLTPSKWLVRILRTIVRPTTGFLPVADAKLLQRRTTGPEAIGHDFI